MFPLLTRFHVLQFVNFTEIMSKNLNRSRKEAEFALAALMEIPSQYKATLELNILKYYSVLFAFSNNVGLCFYGIIIDYICIYPSVHREVRQQTGFLYPHLSMVWHLEGHQSLHSLLFYVQVDLLHINKLHPSLVESLQVLQLMPM